MTRYSISFCCESINPQWEVECVRCTNCSRVLLDYPRPDLGRIRIDGILKGGLRLILFCLLYTSDAADE